MQRKIRKIITLKGDFAIIIDYGGYGNVNLISWAYLSQKRDNELKIIQIRILERKIFATFAADRTAEANERRFDKKI